MYRMSNFNKDSYQVLEKNPRFCPMKKINSRTHKECLNNFFWPKFLSQTPYVLMCIKCMKVTRTKYDIVVIFSKSQISRNFGLLIKHGPHWINFIILIS
jgi:hypothetical protein